MKKNIINKLIPIQKTISFIIHINNMCNFRCNYCIAGKEFSKDFLEYDKIIILIEAIKNISKFKPNYIIHIDITGGEPTLHKNFIDIIKKFLKIDNIDLQISTNALLLSSFKKLFDNIDILENKNKLFFNISYHFFEYKKNVDVFIKSINVLKKYKFNFKIKFLLPDNNEKLEDFLIIKEYIIINTKIDNKDYSYSLIINTQGNISETYNKEILNYYFKNNNLESNNNKDNKDDYIEKNNNLESQGKSLTVEFGDGKSIDYNIEEFKASGLNSFKGYECVYISDNYILIHISPKGEAIFGPCHTLDNIRYNIEDIYDLISSGDKKVICSEKKCISGLLFPKNKLLNNKYILKLEKIILNYINKYLNVFDIINIAISLNNNIQIVLKIDNFFIYYYIEKKIGNKYIFIKDDVGYYFSIKDKKNIIYNINNIDENKSKIINNTLMILSKFDKIYKLILFNE